MAELPQYQDLPIPATTPRTTTPTTPAAPATPQDIRPRWQRIISLLSQCKGDNFHIAALLRDCNPNNITIDDEALTIRFDHQLHLSRFQQELQNPRITRAVQDAIDDVIPGAPPFRVQDDLAPPPLPPKPTMNDVHLRPLVQAAMGLGGRIATVDGLPYPGPTSLISRTPDA